MKSQVAKTRETYNRIASEFAGLHPSRNNWLNELAYFTRLLSGKRVIDIGCGHGPDTSYFIDRGFDYVGIDNSAGMLEEAKKLNPEAKFIQMDLFDLKFPEDSFDGFWAASSLLHIPKREIKFVLRKIAGITKKMGVGFISLKERKNIDEGLVKSDQYGGDERFFSFYALGEFASVLKECGFEIIKDYKLEQMDMGKTKSMLCYFVRKV